MPQPVLLTENAETEQVRRSHRDPSRAYLERTDLKTLLIKIRDNHDDTVILKLKDHLMSDINSVVLDEIISALYSNKVCQALYFQNLSKAMNDQQLGALIGLLKKKKIWCMNLGENYHVSIGGWVSFCNLLPLTLVTHLYISEHVISSDLKKKIRSNIRENRKKHDKHCSLSNVHVIEKCTNMWWNPINSIRHQFAADIAREEKEREEREREERRIQKEKEEAQENLLKLKNKSKAGRFKRPLNVETLTPAHAEYWAEGVGEGGDKPWKFSCSCGEKCSSYEHFRYHPVGRMFECTACSIWSHVQCVLGNISEDDLEELSEILCGSCRGKYRRRRLIDLSNAGITLGADGIPITQPQLQIHLKFQVEAAVEVEVEYEDIVTIEDFDPHIQVNRDDSMDLACHSLHHESASRFEVEVEVGNKVEMGNKVEVRLGNEVEVEVVAFQNIEETIVHGSDINMDEKNLVNNKEAIDTLYAGIDIEDCIEDDYVMNDCYNEKKRKREDTTNFQTEGNEEIEKEIEIEVRDDMKTKEKIDEDLEEVKETDGKEELEVKTIFVSDPDVCINCQNNFPETDCVDHHSKNIQNSKIEFNVQNVKMNLESSCKNSLLVNNHYFNDISNKEILKLNLSNTCDKEEISGYSTIDIPINDGIDRNTNSIRDFNGIICELRNKCNDDEVFCRRDFKADESIYDHRIINVCYYEINNNDKVYDESKVKDNNHENNNENNDNNCNNKSDDSNNSKSDDSNSIKNVTISDDCIDTDGSTDSCSNTDDEHLYPHTFYKHYENNSHSNKWSPLLN